MTFQRETTGDQSGDTSKETPVEIPEIPEENPQTPGETPNTLVGAGEKAEAQALPAGRSNGSGGLLQVVLLCMALVLVLPSTSIFAPVLGEIQDQYGLAFSLVALVASSFGMAKLLMDVPVGYLADAWNVKNLFLAGAFVSLAGNFLSFRASSFALLLVGRVVTGLGAAACQAAILTWITNLSRRSNRSTMLSYFSSARSTGSTVYPFVGGYVGTLFGWPAVFLTAGLLGIVGFLIVAMQPPAPRAGERRAHAEGRKSGSGTEGTSVPGTAPKDTPRDTPKDTPKDRKWATVLAVAAAVSFGFYLNGFRSNFLPLYADKNLGLEPMVIGSVLTLASLLAIPFTLVGGRTADRFGIKPLYVLGHFFTAAVILGFLLVRSHRGLMLGLLFIGVSKVITVVAPTIITKSVEPARRGRALGLYRFAADGGSMAGPIVLGLAYDLSGWGMPIWIMTAVYMVLGTLGWIYLRPAARNVNVPGPQTGAVKG